MLLSTGHVREVTAPVRFGASFRLGTSMRTASPYLLAILLAACNSNTSSSQGPGATGADAAAPADAVQDRAPETDGQTGNGSTTVTATGTRTTSGTGTSTGSASGTSTGTATPLATGTGTSSDSGSGTGSETGTGSGTGGSGTERAARPEPAQAVPPQAVGGSQAAPGPSTGTGRSAHPPTPPLSRPQARR
jgi:hypothetical protein